LTQDQKLLALKISDIEASNIEVQDCIAMIDRQSQQIANKAHREQSAIRSEIEELQTKLEEQKIINKRLKHRVQQRKTSVQRSNSVSINHHVDASSFSISLH
jgi:transcription elongation GreA/GreB family factor